MTAPAGGVTLPELPEPGIDGYMGEPAYTADQMREYARAALAGEWRDASEPPECGGEYWACLSGGMVLMLRYVVSPRSPEGYWTGGITRDIKFPTHWQEIAVPAAPLPKEPGR